MHDINSQFTYHANCGRVDLLVSLTMSTKVDEHVQEYNFGGDGFWMISEAGNLILVALPMVMHRESFLVHPFMLYHPLYL